MVHRINHRIVLLLRMPHHHAYQLLFGQQFESGMLLQLVVVPVGQILHIGDGIENATGAQVVHVLGQQHLATR